MLLQRSSLLAVPFVSPLISLPSLVEEWRPILSITVSFGLSPLLGLQLPSLFHSLLEMALVVVRSLTLLQLPSILVKHGGWLQVYRILCQLGGYFPSSSNESNRI